MITENGPQQNNTQEKDNLFKKELDGVIFGTGNSQNLNSFFGSKLEIDDILKSKLVSSFVGADMNYEFYRTDAGISDDTIQENFKQNTLLNENKIFMALSLLDSPVCEKIINIPDGQEKTVIILGYTKDENVVYLEHNNNGYHLGINPKNSKWSCPVLIFLAK